MGCVSSFIRYKSDSLRHNDTRLDYRFTVSRAGVFLVVHAFFSIVARRRVHGVARNHCGCHYPFKGPFRRFRGESIVCIIAKRCVHIPVRREYGINAFHLTNREYGRSRVSIGRSLGICSVLKHKANQVPSAIRSLRNCYGRFRHYRICQRSRSSNAQRTRTGIHGKRDCGRLLVCASSWTTFKEVESISHNIEICELPVIFRISISCTEHRGIRTQAIVIRRHVNKSA